MKYRFFAIPARFPAEVEADLNRFLSEHRVAAVEKQWVADGPNSFWSVCVAYLDGEPGQEPAKKGRIDYREVLSPWEFAVYAKLRTLRKTLADREGVPAFAVLTNEQLATLVRQRVTTAAAVAEVEGIGKARAEKYAPALLEILKVEVEKGEQAAVEGGPA